MISANPEKVTVITMSLERTDSQIDNKHQEESHYNILYNIHTTTNSIFILMSLFIKNILRVYGNVWGICNMMILKNQVNKNVITAKDKTHQTSTICLSIFLLVKSCTQAKLNHISTLVTAVLGYIEWGKHIHSKYTAFGILPNPF